MTPAPLATLIPALQFLDYLGIAVFAMSGALIAAQKRQTIVTFFFFAVVTGVGGGTLRDLLIGVPIFWVHENWTLLICIAAGLLVWFAPVPNWGGRALVWLDGVGLAAYATYGVAKCLANGAAPLPAFAIGVLSACAGGIIRDIIADEPSIIMRPELYVTAAGISAGTMTVLTITGSSMLVAGSIAALAGFSVRAAAIAKGLSLPGYARERVRMSSTPSSRALSAPRG